MSRLKEKNLKKCVTILKEFIDESSMKVNKKGVAVMALDQLQRITAGSNSDNGCHGRPMADGSPY